ncbi:MAG: tRNA (adenosine(37)-N6)-dimethylallyltransferase MiaA [Actinobacteria bacterium]|nr:tRNA (adenosine(37)-N6)-dimethylallyltransferase MiaA [Actinomycetota bacterium]
MMLLFLVGPTAVGKSDAALDLAEAMGAEIINADALQLYRGMDIGTAKLPLALRRGIPHHMIDVLDVVEEASVATYQRKVHELIASKNGAPLIVVGGSGLYIASLLQELRFPESDPEIRAEIEARAERIGGAALHQELSEKDPMAALAILPGNVRRVVRALEVIEITGQPFTANLPRNGATPYPQAIRVGLLSPRELLDARIAIRVEEMWESGIEAEVAHLELHGLREGKTARAALGYAQILDAKDRGESSEYAKASTIISTRKFARRQESWFRRDEKIEWIPAGTHMQWWSSRS